MVVILAETRAWDLTWPAFKANVLDSLPADLAVCASSSSNVSDPFLAHAQHVWLFHEVEDWGDAYDFAAKEMNAEPKAWRQVLKIKNQVFGGVKDKENEHWGSAGILLFFRWFLLHELKRSGLEDAYNWFIVTRSDYYYPLPHPSPHLLEALYPGRIWVPIGEEYEGISDRHTVVSRTMLRPALNLLDDVFLKPDELFKNMSGIRPDKWNLESFIKYHWTKVGIWPHVAKFPRCMFAVRSQGTPTRWARGHKHQRLNMYIKYDAEFNDSMTTLMEYTILRHDWVALIKAYITHST